MTKRCKWFGGSTSSGAEAKCLRYTPTSSRHPKGWKYAFGPYRTRTKALQAFTSPTHISGYSKRNRRSRRMSRSTKRSR
jgi:hypothetical protein